MAMMKMTTCLINSSLHADAVCSLYSALGIHRDTYLGQSEIIPPVHRIALT